MLDNVVVVAEAEAVVLLLLSDYYYNVQQFLSLSVYLSHLLLAWNLERSLSLSVIWVQI